MTEALAAAARERSERSRASVLAVVRALEKSDDAVSVRGVAEQAGVSRNFIYSTPECLEAVRKAITRGRNTKPQVLEPRPGGRTSEASLQTRLVAAIADNDNLHRRIAELEAQNAALVGTVVDLQNPQPANVANIRRRRG